MIPSFRRSIEKTKIDSIMAEKLLEDTEKFFENTEALRSKLYKYISPSMPSINKKSNTRVKSHIY